MKQQGKGLVIVRTHRSLHYATVKLTAVEDHRLSYKAKGLHTYLISRPPEWKIYHHDLLARATDGKDSVTSGIKELKKYAYLRIELVRNGGRITGAIWHVYEEPHMQPADPPYPEEPDTENPYPGNPQQSINNRNNNNQITTTGEVVVKNLKGKVNNPFVSDTQEDLKAIVHGTPFEKVDCQRWLKQPDFLDRLDKLVQTYAGDFSKAERPQALVMNVMRHGAIAPDGYVPYHERWARSKAAAAKAKTERLEKDKELALREETLRKFNDLEEEERRSLIKEASATLGPVLGASKGLSMALALDLLRGREESGGSQGISTSFSHIPE